MKELLAQYKNSEVTEEDMIKKLMVKQQLPQRPYFRTTKSRAIALYGVRRDPIVLYRPQWLRLSRVFSGGKKCVFNKFFFNEVEEKSKKEEVDKLVGQDKMENLQDITRGKNQELPRVGQMDVFPGFHETSTPVETNNIGTVTIDPLENLE